VDEKPAAAAAKPPAVVAIWPGQACTGNPTAFAILLSVAWLDASIAAAATGNQHVAPAYLLLYLLVRQLLCQLGLTLLRFMLLLLQEK
jgi:hypothetical protein